MNHWAAVVFLAAVAALAQGAAGKGFAETVGYGFIRVGGLPTHGENGGSFQEYFADKNCREFRFSGWNSWEVVEAAYGKPNALPKDDWNVDNGRDLVRWIFDSVEDAGIKVGRFFAHGWDKKKMTLLTGPGVYNEEALKALDWVIAEAGERDLKLIMTFADNWKDGDSRKMWAVDFNGKEPMDFYSDETIIQQYKDHITTIVNRQNTVNNIKYKDDPTIFAWDLINEPRCDCQISEGGPFCELTCAETLNNWVGDISKHLKSQDPHHMAVVGEEGFYSLSPWRHWVNPDAFFSGGSPWAQRAGQDYIENHAHDSIDYLSIHSWPDNWSLPEIWFQETWVREHNRDGWSMMKPFVVEEFGKVVIEDDDLERKTVRDPFIQALYDNANSIRGSGGPLKGVAFWELDASNHTKPGPYGIRPTHTTWKIIKDQSWWVRQELDKLPVLLNCVPGESRSMDAVFGDGDVYYTSAGVNLLSNSEGEAIGAPTNETSIKECIALCDDDAGCESFRYNKGLELGTCELQKESGDGYYFNKGGWQTFWKNTASTDCSAEDCELCDDNDVCIKCAISKTTKKPLVKTWDDEASTVVCQ